MVQVLLYIFFKQFMEEIQQVGTILHYFAVQWSYLEKLQILFCFVYVQNILEIDYSVWHRKKFMKNLVS